MDCLADLAKDPIEKESFYRKALAEYDKAIQIYPQNAGALSNRGLTKYNLGDYKGARFDCEMAIFLFKNQNQTEKTRKDMATALSNLATILFEHHESKYAILYLDEAIRIRPKYAIAYNNRGEAKAALGDKVGAKADFLKAAKLFDKVGSVENAKHARDAAASL